MTASRPRVLFALNRWMWEQVGTDSVVRALDDAFAWEVEFFELHSDWTEPPEPNAREEARLIEAAQAAGALVISHGSPRITGELLDAVPGIRFVGELEGDRFASRIDVEACLARGVRVVDTNNFASPPVAEWALALTLMGLRNYGAVFRRIVLDRAADYPPTWESDPGYLNGELRGKTVGILGFGFIARSLIELLEPFETTIYVHDPYVPPEFAEIYRVTLTSLDNVLSLADVLVSTVPLTPRTEGMLGTRELGLMKKGAIFVNVSRGKIVQSDALAEKARSGELIVCLDVTDPEPLPSDAELIDIPTTILSPHIAGQVAAGYPRSGLLMVEELRRHFSGHEPWYQILPRTVMNRRGAEVRRADMSS